MEYSYLENIAFYIPLLPAVFALFKWQLMNKAQRWFAFLLWGIVIVSFSGELYLSLAMKKNNMPFFHLYILMEYLFLLQVFRYMFEESISKNIWRTLGIGYLIIWVFNVISGEGWWGFPDYIHALEAIVMIVLIILWFLKMLREKTILQPIKTFEFWMCTGLLVFFTGSFLLFLFPKFLIDTSTEVFKVIWNMNCILIILLSLTYTIALLWVRKMTK